jgi:sodium-dependent dicarboxylate transporter 2/3/5
MTAAAPTAGRSPLLHAAALAAGPLFGALVYTLVPDSSVGLDGELLELGRPGRVTAALACWMAIWWLTEAIPVYATALLPLAVLPLTGARSLELTASSYAHPLIFLFLGGFMLALALERWGLHRRFALAVLRVVGTQPSRLVAGFMFVSAALSMWISNTATALVMLPIAMSVIAMQDRDAPATRNFALCLLLGVAYGASIGGVGTIIGTPPNLFTVSFMARELGVEISFLRWMMIGVPVVIVFLPITWLLLTRVLFRVDAAGAAPITIDTRPEPWQRGARLTLIIFTLTAGAWILQPLLAKLPGLGNLSDTVIAIIAALLLFATPADLQARKFLMDWETVTRLPWGVLILFGGGLALAGTISANGIGELLAAQLDGLQGVPPIIVTLTVVALIIFLTELTSNTATTAALVPIFAAMAIGMGLDPVTVIIPAAIAASCAFMLPVATPPNAIVFGSGMISVPQMARAGVWLNLTGIVILTLLTQAILPFVIGD